MFRTTRLHRPPARRGAILLVVLALLALFAVIGLSFALFAESAAKGSRIDREATNQNAGLDPSVAANSFLGQLIYPTDPRNDPANNYLLSAMTGHELARLMYGHNLAAFNDVPYNGVGQIHENLIIPGLPNPLPRTDVIYHGLVRLNPNNPQTWVVVDAEYTRGNGLVRTGQVVGGPNQREFQLPNLLVNDFTGINNPPDPFTYFGKNAPYTYPDRNNVAIALINPVDGQVIVPSMHRPALFGTLDPPGTGSVNPNWILPSGRFKLLRPRRVDHLTAAERNDLGAINEGPLNAIQVSALSDLPKSNPNELRVGRFPYSPRNPDGTITGDVQNLRFADGRQRMDSFWIDANLPTQTWRGDRQVVPLIAPIIIPLDGRINLNVAGNVKATGFHGSNMGFGPHEINLQRLLNYSNITNPQQSAQRIVGTRYDAQNPTGAVTPPPLGATLANRFFQPNPFAPDQATLDSVPPVASQVDWAGTSTTAMQLPAGLASVPGYNAYYNTDPAQPTNHPTFFNPYERLPLDFVGPNQGPHTYPTADLRRTAGRYSDKTQLVTSQSVYPSQNRFFPEFGNTGPVPSGQELAGNQNRALVTPFSNHLKRPGLAPNFLDGATVFQLPGIDLSDPNRAAINPQFGVIATPLPPTINATVVNTTPFSDANGQSALRNIRAALSAVDVNRFLTDYRTDLTLPLGPTNIGNAQQARIDRQTLARDIFLRLAVATGARIAFDVNAPANSSYYGQYILPQPDGAGGYQFQFSPQGMNPPPPPVPVTVEEYNALRWLAQFAANIVDYIDNDDVILPFVFNPDPASGIPNPADPVANQITILNASMTAANLPERVVFGTEKPRVVLNEVYAEVANDWRDASNSSANNDFHVRFFVELLNPNNAETAATSPLAGPDTSNANRIGSVPLQYTAEGISVYRIEVYEQSDTVRQRLEFDRASASVQQFRQNVLGVPTGLTPRLQAQMTGIQIDPANSINAADKTRLANMVEPNNGQFSGVTAPDRNGFAVIGPAPNDASQYQPDNTAFVPDTANGPYAMLLRKPADSANPGLDSLFYTLGRVPPGDIAQTLQTLNQNGGHAVMLQRLANPYQPFDATFNPYVTVDYQASVQVRDGIRVGSPAGVMGGDRGMNAAPPPEQRSAIGRVQPYTAFGDPTQTYPETFVIPQRNLSGMMPMPTGYQNSFFRHNWGDAANPPPANANVVPGTSPESTLRAPFEWLVHMDRKLVNVIELMHVSTVRPFEMTHRFARVHPDTNAADRMLFHRHDLQHPPLYDAMGVLQVRGGPLFDRDGAGQVVSPMYRVFDALTVKPWMYNVAQGGRVPGQVNINMIWDEYTSGGQPSSRILEALLDPQTGNRFTAADVQVLWQRIRAARNPQSPSGPPAVANTFAETGSVNDDRPFKSFGVGILSPLPPGTAGVQNRSGLEDTLLRLSGPVQMMQPPPPSLLQNTGVAPTHPYIEWEPLRKLMNNITTTSDSYLVIFTVGYFELREVDASGPLPRRILGAEVFDEVPGDLRTQYVAVVDRSMLAQRTGNDPTVPNPTPWFAELQTPVPSNPVSAPNTPLPAPNDYVQIRIPAVVATGTQPGQADTGNPDNSEAPLVPNDTQFFITPRQVFDASINQNVQRLEVSGVYEGQRWTIHSDFHPSYPGPTNTRGTRFFLGSGANAEEVEAFFNPTVTPTPPSQTSPARWTFNPTTGVARITVRRVAGNNAPHAAGDVVSNLLPGHTGNTATTFDLSQAQARQVIRYFARLNPQ